MTSRHSGVQLLRWALVAAVILPSACRSSRPASVAEPKAAAEAAAVLNRPLPGDLAALYELTIPSSGGLRLTVLQLGDSGRMSVNEPFGAAVSMVEWSHSGDRTLFDYREGCRVEGPETLGVLGVRALPLPNAVRLLGGRLPAVEGDRVEVLPDGRIEVAGPGWVAAVTVRPDPWRVVLVEEIVQTAEDGWRLRLKDHSGSVPGWVRVEGQGHRWAELDLRRLQWDTVDELPERPALPLCEQRFE